MKLQLEASPAQRTKHANGYSATTWQMFDPRRKTQTVEAVNLQDAVQKVKEFGFAFGENCIVYVRLIEPKRKPNGFNKIFHSPPYFGTVENEKAA